MLRGVVGWIRWHYYTAAQIEGYTVTWRKSGRAIVGWDLAATVVLADAFKLAQTPLIFVATYKGGEWKFPIRSYTLHEGHRLIASLDPPEGFNSWSGSSPRRP